MSRRDRRDRREEIFAVQSDVEEESAIETVLTDAEEDWTATPYGPEPRSSRRRSAPKVLKQKTRHAREDVPWDHHQKHRRNREPVGMSEKIERRLAEREHMMARGAYPHGMRNGGRDPPPSSSRGKSRSRRSKSTPRKPLVIYDEDDDSFLPSYNSCDDDDEAETNITSISDLKRALKKQSKLRDKNKKSKSKKDSSRSDKKKKKGSKFSTKKRGRNRKKRNGDVLDGLMVSACDASGDVYGVACKMVDKAFQLDSSDEDSSSDDDSSSDESETYVTAASSESASATAITEANDTTITGASETVATEGSSAIPSYQNSGTTATATSSTEYTEATPGLPPPRRSRRAPHPPQQPSSTRIPRKHPSPVTPKPSRGITKPMVASMSPKQQDIRYKRVVAPPGKLGISLKSSPQGPTIKMVSRHCPVNAKAGDVIARVNGKSVLRMESRDVMEMFATMQKREKIIDLLPQGSHSPRGGPAVATPRRSGAGPSISTPQSSRSRAVSTNRAQPTGRARRLY